MTRYIYLPRRVLAVLLASSALLLLTACSEQPFAAERTYISNLLDHVQRTLDTVNSLHNTATQPRLDDPAWYNELNAQNQRLRSLISEARQMNPPPNLAEVHQRYLGVMDNLEQASSSLDQAAQFRNSAAVQQAQERIDQARAAIEQIRQRVNNLQGE
jgi:uncharacterized membrane protein YccC